MEKLTGTNSKSQEEKEREEKIKQEKEARDMAIQTLLQQQEDIGKQIQALKEGSAPIPQEPQEDPVTKALKAALAGENKGPQEVLLQQLRNALTNKQEQDPNKMLLKALITEQNKTTMGEGPSTLKPHILNSILGGDSSPSMADWLANLNKQEQDEYLFSKNNLC